MRGSSKDARSGDCATGEKESIGIPLYGYANDGGGKRGEKKVKWIRESATRGAAVVRREGLRRGKSGRSKKRRGRKGTGCWGR